MKIPLLLLPALIPAAFLLNGCMMGGHHLIGGHHTGKETASVQGTHLEKEIVTPDHKFRVQIPPLFAGKTARITYRVLDNEAGIPVSGVDIFIFIREFRQARVGSEESDKIPILTFPPGQTDSEGFYDIEYQPANSGSAEIVAEFRLAQSSSQEPVTLQATQAIAPSQIFEKRDNAWVPLAILGSASMVAMMIIFMGLSWH